MPVTPISEHPDIIRARAAGDAVRAAGGSAMDAALKEIKVAFDETARRRSEAERRERIEAAKRRATEAA